MLTCMDGVKGHEEVMSSVQKWDIRGRGVWSQRETSR